MGANAMNWVAGHAGTEDGDVAPTGDDAAKKRLTPKIRLAHVGTGATGSEALKGILRHPDLELVSLWVTSPDKVGRDAGALVGLETAGVTAVGSLDATQLSTQNVLSYCGNGLGRKEDVIREIPWRCSAASTWPPSLCLDCSICHRRSRGPSGG